MPAALAAASFMPGVSELVFLSQSSQKRDCVGCKESSEHIEDIEYTRTMSQFPVDLNALRQEHQMRVDRYMRLQHEASAPPMQTPEEESQVDDDSATPGALVDPNFFRHKVSSNDTLTGLALHYKTNTNAIKQANSGFIIGEMFNHLTYIRIPRVEGVRGRECAPLAANEAQLISIKDFMRLGQRIANEKVSREEAVYYLSSVDYVLQEALEMFAEDISAM